MLILYFRRRGVSQNGGVLIVLVELWSLLQVMAWRWTGDKSLFEPVIMFALQWCHNERGGVSNHRRPDCRSKKTSKFRVTGLCKGNPPVTAILKKKSSLAAPEVVIMQPVTKISSNWRHFRVNKLRSHTLVRHTFMLKRSLNDHTLIYNKRSFPRNWITRERSSVTRVPAYCWTLLTSRQPPLSWDLEDLGWVCGYRYR